jgi:VIT1/CCC1 family predicted Fe2+/Mn2+ transporter
LQAICRLIMPAVRRLRSERRLGTQQTLHGRHEVKSIQVRQADVRQCARHGTARNAEIKRKLRHGKSVKQTRQYNKAPAGPAMISYACFAMIIGVLVMLCLFFLLPLLLLAVMCTCVSVSVCVSLYVCLFLRYLILPVSSVLPFQPRALYYSSKSILL